MNTFSIDVRSLVERTFYAMTGVLPPGCDVSAVIAAGYPSYEDRDALWRDWSKNHRDVVRHAVRQIVEDLRNNDAVEEVIVNDPWTPVVKVG